MPKSFYQIFFVASSMLLLAGCFSSNNAVRTDDIGISNTPEETGGGNSGFSGDYGAPAPMDENLVQAVAWTPIAFSKLEGEELVLETGAEGFNGKVRLDKNISTPGETIELALPSSTNHFFIDLDNGNETLSLKFVGDEVQEVGTERVHPLNGNDRLHVTVSAFRQVAIFINDSLVKTDKAFATGDETSLTVRFC